MYEIVITVKDVKGECSRHQVGDQFRYRNGYLLTDKKGFCAYALAGFISLLPALEREIAEPEDVLSNVKELTCLDPKGKVIFQVTRHKME